jgi:hypothetical protein
VNAARVHAVAVAALALGSCADPLKEPQRIEATRVLGVRAEVAGMPEVASPSPGQAVVVRWLVASPAADRAFGTRLQACVAAPVEIGIPGCESPPVAAEANDPAPATELRFAFTVPARDALRSMRMAVLGTVCDGAPVEADAPWPAEHCAGGAPPLPVSYEMDVVEGPPNHNPELGPSALAWDGGPWVDPGPILDLPVECANAPPSDALPRVAAGTVHRIGLRTRDEDRESLPADSFSGPTRESLLVSHAATAGEIERPWSTVGPDGPSDLSVGFTAPAPVPDRGRLARVYFVVRDQRGGADFAVRALCVVP